MLFNSLLPESRAGAQEALNIWEAAYGIEASGETLPGRAPIIIALPQSAQHDAASMSRGSFARRSSKPS